MSKFVSSDLLNILQCPNCAGTIKLQGSCINCTNCQCNFPVIDGIPDLRPKERMRLPNIYEDSNLKRWQKMLPEVQDYFYNPRSPVSYIQNSAHRIIKKLRSHKIFANVLDIGCGDGAHIPYLNANENYFGLDIDIFSLKKLRKNFPKFPVFCGDVYRLPVRSKSIECIVSVYNLEHIAYLDLALEEMARVLMPTGEVFMGLPNEGGISWGIGRRLTSYRKFNAASLDYKRVMEIEHINCIWQLVFAVKRYFKIEQKILFPLRLPFFHINLVSVLRCCSK
jgi:SAM-dependent methyltransferase